MTAFYVCGGILAGWAVLVSFLGITREGFPATDGSARVVMGLSVILMLAAVLSGVIGSALHESHEDEEHETDAAALVR